jgi:hypothetical protein
MNRHFTSRLAAGATILLAMAAAQAQPIAGRGTWETTLHARDINGDSVVDAYFDSVQNITWLANANAGAGSVFDDGYAAGDGRMTWSSANAWAQGLDVHGVTGWRLPQFVVGRSQSEISRMYFDTLGNAPYPPTSATDPPPGWANTALFSNLGSWYWLSDAGSVPGRHQVWAVDHISTYHSLEPDSSNYRGWAVHDGNVTAAVPEPETYALMLLGLAAVWVAGRRRKGC